VPPGVEGELAKRRGSVSTLRGYAARTPSVSVASPGVRGPGTVWGTLTCNGEPGGALPRSSSAMTSAPAPRGRRAPTWPVRSQLSGDQGHTPQPAASVLRGYLELRNRRANTDRFQGIFPPAWRPSRSGTSGHQSVARPAPRRRPYWSLVTFRRFRSSLTVTIVARNDPNGERAHTPYSVPAFFTDQS
jgi:hypothetical protein